MNVDAMQYSVDELVPHKYEMSLLDEIVDYDDTSLSSQVTIRADSEFLNEENTVPAWLGIEYMAQTIAAWAGIQNRKDNSGIKLGYLVGTRKYKSYVTSFPLNCVLKITIKINYQSNGLGSFECTISSDQLLAEANLNVYQP